MGIWDYLFSPISSETRRIEQLDNMEQFLQTPLHTAQYFKFEISCALIVNILITYGAKTYVLEQLELFFGCQILTTFLILILCFCNVIGIVPKLFIIGKITSILGNSHDQDELKNRLKGFFVSKIYFLNQYLSKTILVLYGVGLILQFYNWVFGDSCLQETGLYGIAKYILLCFIIRLVISIIRNIVIGQRGYGLTDDKLKQMKEVKVVLEEIQLVKQDIDIDKFGKLETDQPIEELETCAICMEEYFIEQNVKLMECKGKHFYHANCIDKWLKIENKCPLCNGIANKSI